MQDGSIQQEEVHQQIEEMQIRVMRIVQQRVGIMDFQLQIKTTQMEMQYTVMIEIQEVARTVQVAHSTMQHIQD